MEELAQPPASRPLAAASLVVLFSAVALRLWQLDNVPGVNGDEAWYGVLAKEITQGRVSSWQTPTGNPLNPFYVGPLVLLHFVAEPSVLLLRSVAAASGILALAVNYLLCRRIYGSTTATISTLILAVLPINIAYGRFGWDASQSLFATLPVVYLSIAAARARPRPWRPLAAGAAALVAALLVHPTNIFVAPFIMVAGLKVLAQIGIGARVFALPRPARAAFYSALGLAATSTAWLLGQWLPIAVRPAFDGQQILEFLNRFQRLFTGVTVYQFIPGNFGAPVSMTSQGASVAIYDIAGLTVLGAAVALFISRVRQTLDETDSMLLLSWAASLAGFYLIAGPEAIAPHWERYGICLVGATTLVVARSATGWLRSSARTDRLAASLLIAGALMLGSFYWNYFRVFATSGGNSHLTFRTGPHEPKAAAIAHISRHRSVDQTHWIVTTTWWNYWPLAYLASAEQGLQVVWADKVWTDAAVLAAARAGRVWVVEFAGSEEAAAGRVALSRASQPVATPGDPAASRPSETFMFDYGRRPVLSVFRSAPAAQ